MIFPVDRENGRRLRVPWATVTIAIVCAGVFAAVHGSDRMLAAAVDRGLEDAWAYFERHPYVELAPETEELFGAGEVAAARSTYQRERGDTPPSSFVLRNDQIEFDRRQAILLDAIHSHSFHRWGFKPSDPYSPGVITHIFVHDGALHLLANLLILVMAGICLEMTWGRTLYTLLFFGSGAASAAAFAYMEPDASVPLGGASGAAVGLIGAFIIRYGLERVRYFWFIPPVFRGYFTATSWLTFPIWGAVYFGVQYLYPITEQPDAVAIAHWAHAGGAGFGLLFALILQLLGVGKRRAKSEADDEEENAILTQVKQARKEERWDDALELLCQELASNPSDRELSLAYWEVAHDAGDPRQAASAIRRVIREELFEGDDESAARHLLELLQRTGEFGDDPPFALKAASVLAEAGDREAALTGLRQLASGECGPIPAAIAVRTARMAAPLDPVVARSAARVALESGELAMDEADEMRVLVDAVIESEPSSPEVDSDMVEEPAAAADEQQAEEPADDRLAAFDPSARDLSEDFGGEEDVQDEPENDGSGDFDWGSNSMEDQWSDDAEAQPSEESEPATAVEEEEKEDENEETASYALRELRITEAVPLSMTEDALIVSVPGKGKARVGFHRIEALAVAAVRGLQPKPIVMIDLVLNWVGLETDALKIVRLRSDRFDPRKLAPEVENPGAALREFLKRLLEGSGGTALPGAAAVTGDPFQFFDELAGYERLVLHAKDS